MAKRKYEFVFIVDPRMNDEEVVGLSDGYKEMIQSAGGEIVREESWGKRKLAYPIETFNEGKYTLFVVESDGNPLIEVEQRMRQNERVLRYLTVRIDSARRRGSASPKEAEPVAAVAAEAGSAPAGKGSEVSS